MKTKGTLGFSFGCVGFGASWAFQHIRLGLLEVWWCGGSLRQRLIKEGQHLAAVFAALNRKH